MQLIGQAICHEIFGKGIVTDWNKNVLTVCFPAGDKKFIYPDAFAKHLTLRNHSMQDKIQSLLDARAAEKEAEQQAFQETLERRNLLRSMKISSVSQAAFHITEAQEKDLFSTWAISTGTYLSGYSKGKPRIPDRMKPNSLCLLTKREAGAQERDRRIIGAFMVEEEFFGVYCRDGIINAHLTCRAALSPEKQLAFWPYITEDSKKWRWGNTALRYFSNQTAEKILFDILKLADTTEEQENIYRFYQYFCRLNRLSPQGVKEDEHTCG